MKTPILCTSWKMNLSFDEGLSYARKLADFAKKNLKKDDNLEVIICPDFLILSDAMKIFKGTILKVGAQDCFWEDEGSYTGEISPKHLKEIGCRYVFCGHIERVRYLKEDDSMINLKVRACLRNNLKPFVFLVESEKFDDIRGAAAELNNKIKQYTNGVSEEDLVNIVFIYEPAWAIGAMQAAPVDYTRRILQLLRESLGKQFGKDAAANQVFMYGGGVTLDSARQILELDNINGIGMGKAGLNYDFITGAMMVARDIGNSIRQNVI